jgi:hypothetical protein
VDSVREYYVKFKEIKVFNYRWIKLLAVFSLLVAVLAVNAVPVGLVQADGDDVTVIAVPSGDVDALYAAVYDENGEPRDNVEIVLEAGDFQLDSSKPSGGRLVLGDNTILRSTLRMAVDGDGVPVVDDNYEPIVLEEGATIDGSGLEPEIFGEGIIIVGDRGLVEQLWLDGGNRPGVVITSKGTVRKVASTGHSVGFQVRAVGQEAYATVEGNLSAGNSFLGISILALDPLLGHPTGRNVEVRANLRNNASANNGSVNLGIYGGVGSTNNSQVHVESFHNVFRQGATLGNVRIVGGQNVFAPGSNNNEVYVKLVGNEIADTAIGLKVEGGYLTSLGSFPLEERQSSNNQVVVTISDTTFENNSTDIVAYGSQSTTYEQGGDNNEVKVVIQSDDDDDGATTFTIEALDCFPEENFQSCTNQVTVTFGRTTATVMTEPALY